VAVIGLLVVVGLVVVMAAGVVAIVADVMEERDEGR